MSIPKRRILVNSFCKGQFNYYLLIWICHSHENNMKINRFHERCLRNVYNDKQSSFNELLTKNGSVSIHVKNLQILATEMYKVRNYLPPPIVKGLFVKN